MTFEKKHNLGKSKIVGHLAALLTATCWGCSFIASKVLMEDALMTPVEVYVYRFALAYLMLLLFTFREMRSKSWIDELQLALCGVCSGTLYFLMENYALTYTTTGNVSLLSSISPIFTAIFLSIIYKTKMKKGEVIGSSVAFIGVAMVIFSESIGKGLGFEIHPFGDILALSCAISWAVYSIAIKRLIPIYNTLFITRKLFFYGLLTSVPLLLMQSEPMHFSVLLDFSHPVFLLDMLFLAVMCSSMAYLLWNESMKIIGPFATNNYIYIQPPVTMIAGWLFLGEKIYMLGYLGCFFILMGLVLADKMKK